MIKSPHLFLILTLFFVCQVHAVAAQSDPTRVQTLRTQSGVTFTLPERFLPEPVTPAAAQDSGPINESLFVDGDTPAISVTVARGGLDGTQALRTLPTQSGPLPAAFAQGYIAGLQNTARGAAVTPGEYDAGRHAFTARINGRAPSPARILAAQPEQSPTWRQLAGAGGDIALTRCLLQGLLKDGDNFEVKQAAGRISHAAATCRISDEKVAAYVHAQPANFFMGARLSQLAINFIMPSSMTVVTVSGPPAHSYEIEQLFSSIWVSARVEGSAEHEPSRLSRLLAFSDVQIARMIGVVMGSLVATAALMALLGWLLTKLRAPLALALTVPAALLLGFVVIDMITSATPSAYTTAKFFAYGLSVSLLIKPLGRWLSARRYA